MQPQSIDNGLCEIQYELTCESQLEFSIWLEILMHTTSRHLASQIVSTRMCVDLFYPQFLYLPYHRMRSLPTQGQIKPIALQH